VYTTHVSAEGSDDRQEVAIKATVAHLAGRFGEAVPPDELEAIVRASFADWPDARIRDFIPVLAERRAKALVEDRTGERRSGRPGTEPTRGEDD
jgi:hypothetical protein